MRWWQPWALFVALVPSAAAMAQCQYEVQSWDPHRCPGGLPLPYSGAGLNDLGAWCGHRIMCWPGTGYEPIYCPPNGTPQVLPMPPGAGTDGAKANAVNNSGVVVGFMYSGPSSQWLPGVIWRPDGSVEVIPSVNGTISSTAKDINDAGVIVGDSGGLPYVLENGVMTSIPSPGLGNGFARSIANSGDVTGVFGNLNSNARAFRWKGGTLVLLEPVPGYPVSSASGVNSHGWVAGQSRTTTTPVIQRPTVWIDDLPMELPMPPGYTTGAAAGINDAGIIFGSASGPGVSSTPLIWVDGVVYKVSDLIVPGSPSIGGVVDISEVGQLLGSGGPRIATPLATSPADLDGDCAVDGDDLGVLLASWGAPDFDPRCDFNGDGVVNGDDLGTLLGDWSATK